MPKVTDTRKIRAIELYAMLVRGPAYYVVTWHSSKLMNKQLANQEAAQHYKMWSEAWILNELVSLVPELKTLGREGADKKLCPECRSVRVHHYPGCSANKGVNPNG